MAKILLVDDDTEHNEMIRGILIPEGHHVITTENPLEAFSMVKKDKFDLVLCDEVMPEMLGRELMRKINSEIMDPPVVLILTGYVEIATLDTTYLLKPINNVELLSVIAVKVD